MVDQAFPKKHHDFIDDFFVKKNCAMNIAGIKLESGLWSFLKERFQFIRFFVIVWLGVFIVFGLFLALKSNSLKPLANVPVQALIDVTGQLNFSTVKAELKVYEANRWESDQLNFLSDLYPVWIKFDVPLASGFSKVILHGKTIKNFFCVDEGTGSESVSLQSRVGPYWMLDVNTSDYLGAWICRVEFFSPGSLSVELHYAENFKQWEDDFKEKNSLVQGALLTMCIMSALLIKLIGYRKSICLVVWILMTLNFLAMSGGWEIHLYLYRLFGFTSLVWLKTNLFLLLCAMTIFAYFIAQEHRSYWSYLYVRGLFLATFFAALVLIFCQTKTSFLTWYWPLLLSVSCLSCLVLYTWFAYEHRRKNGYLYLALFTFLIGAFFELISPWVILENVQNAAGGRALALVAAILIVLAVSDSINNNRGQKIQLLKNLEVAMKDLEAFFQLIPQAVFMLNKAGDLVRTNRVFDVLEENVRQSFGLSILGEEPMQMVQKSLQFFVDSEGVEQLKPYVFDLSNRQGIVQHFELHAVPAPKGFIGVIRDITSERTKELAQFYRIIHDEATGVMNKAGLEHLLGQLKDNNLEHCTVIRLEISNPSLMANGHLGMFSNLALRQLAGQVKGACQFLGDLVYLGHAVFVVLAKPGKGEQACDLFQEARLWSRFKIDGPSDSPYMVNIASLLVDLRHGPIDALNQIEQPKRYVSIGGFQLAVGCPKPVHTA